MTPHVLFHLYSNWPFHVSVAAMHMSLQLFNVLIGYPCANKEI